MYVDPDSPNPVFHYHLNACVSGMMRDHQHKWRNRYKYRKKLGVISEAIRREDLFRKLLDDETVSFSEAYYQARK